MIAARTTTEPDQRLPARSPCPTWDPRPADVDVASGRCPPARRAPQQRVRLRPVLVSVDVRIEHRVAVRDLHLGVGVAVRVQDVGHLLRRHRRGECVLRAARRPRSRSTGSVPAKSSRPARARSRRPRKRTTGCGARRAGSSGSCARDTCDRVLDVHSTPPATADRRRSVLGLAGDAALQTEPVQVDEPWFRAIRKTVGRLKK